MDAFDLDLHLVLKGTPEIYVFPTFRCYLLKSNKSVTSQLPADIHVMEVKGKPWIHIHIPKLELPAEDVVKPKECEVFLALVIPNPHQSTTNDTTGASLDVWNPNLPLEKGGAGVPLWRTRPDMSPQAIEKLLRKMNLAFEIQRTWNGRVLRVDCDTDFYRAQLF